MQTIVQKRGGGADGGNSNPRDPGGTPHQRPALSIENPGAANGRFSGREPYEASGCEMSGLLDHGFLDRDRERLLIWEVQQDPASRRGRRACDILLRANMRLVASQIAKRWLPEASPLSRDDLAQAGARGLVEAIHRFDLDHDGESGLGGYASVRIAKRIQQCVRGGARAVRLPDHVEDEIGRARRGLCAETDDGEDHERLLAVEHAATFPVSLDAPPSSRDVQEDSDMHERVIELHPNSTVEEVASAEAEALDMEDLPLLTEDVRLALAAMPGDMRTVVQLRYELPGADTPEDNETSFRAIGEYLGCSGERARYLHDKAIASLKEAAGVGEDDEDGEGDEAAVSAFEAPICSAPPDEEEYVPEYPDDEEWTLAELSCGVREVMAFDAESIEEREVA